MERLDPRRLNAKKRGGPLNPEPLEILMTEPPIIWRKRLELCSSFEAGSSPEVTLVMSS